MKKLVSLLAVLLMCSGLWAYSAGKYASDGILWNTMQDITPDVYDTIMKGDVFSLFDITGYTTELQKKKFLQSEEGQFYTDQLDALKEALADGEMAGYIDRDSNGRYKVTEFVYDLDLGGFLIPIGSNYSSGHSSWSWWDDERTTWGWDETDMAKGMFFGMYCPNLNEEEIVEKVAGTWPKNGEWADHEPIKNYFYLCECEEDLALEIERTGAILWYRFNLAGYKTQSFDIYSNGVPKKTYSYYSSDSRYAVEAKKYDKSYRVTGEYTIEHDYSDDETWYYGTLTDKNVFTVYNLEIILVNPETYKSYGTLICH
ncbi:MAG: hypothetical protein MJ183_04960 [Treponemataceae bacterium]|nr:hypothetical protein [Treponemataceae bacterium]